MTKQIYDIKNFFRYVIPSVLSFALSGVYAIVDGFFVGNSMGDIGLSAVNIAYPIVAVIQALGTGLVWEVQFTILSIKPKKKRLEPENLQQVLYGY